jgi:hypothetical protein
LREPPIGWATDTSARWLECASWAIPFRSPKTGRSCGRTELVTTRVRSLVHSRSPTASLGGNKMRHSYRSHLETRVAGLQKAQVNGVIPAPQGHVFRLRFSKKSAIALRNVAKRRLTTENSDECCWEEGCRDMTRCVVTGCPLLVTSTSDCPIRRPPLLIASSGLDELAQVEVIVP